MTKVNVALVVSVVALVIAGLLYFGGVGQKSLSLFGSTACSNITCLSGGLRLVADAGGDFETDIAAVFGTTVKIGTAGTVIDQLINGSCSLALATGNTTFTIPATTTSAFDCSTAGSVLGDTVLIQMATSSLATGGGFTVESVSASTTAGSSRVHVRNNTGASAVLPASLASSTPYTVISR